MLTRIRELARCLVASARGKAERDRVHTVALQHATDTLDHVTVDTFGLTRLEGARGQEHGWIERTARDVDAIQVERVLMYVKQQSPTVPCR